MTKRTLYALAAMTFLLAACGGPPEPVVPCPPSVEVASFQSTLITPETIRFVGKVRIVNQMRAGLDIDKVDYSADLHDRPLFDETFAELHPMRARGVQTVTLPFQVAMKDVVNQAEDVLAEEAIRVRLRGVVHPRGFEPIAFEATKVIPMPSIPLVAIDGVRGTPLDGGAFTVFLRVKNGNCFPLTFTGIDSFLNLNGKRYDLLRTESFKEVAPGGSGRIALTMRHTQGKGLSMIVNVAKNLALDFTVGGSISCQTPHGLFHIPLEIGTGAQAAPR